MQIVNQQQAQADSTHDPVRFGPQLCRGFPPPRRLTEGAADGGQALRDAGSIRRLDQRHGD
jgi:hypothetical protein